MIEASFAPNTLQAYQTGKAAYKKFLQQAGLKMRWPPLVSNVTSFIADMSLRLYSPATARLYVAGLGYYCKLKGVQDTTQNFVVKKMLLGMERVKKEKDSRLPITPKILEQVLEQLPFVCSTSYEACMFKALYSMAYFGVFRVGELVADSVKYHRHALLFDDVKFTGQNAEISIHLRHSKADQSGQGITIGIPSISSKLCPVKKLKQYLKIRPVSNKLLFCHYDGTPVTRYQFSAVLNKTIHALKLDATKYKSHSFRIGAASIAIELGLKEEEVERLGRWESRAYKSYIRIPSALLAGNTSLND